jgi:hypothetical protein
VVIELFESDNVSFCFYEAIRPADVRAHSMLLAAPCDEVWQVMEVCPTDR